MTRGPRPRDDQQRQPQKMDVVVPGSSGSAAAVLCEGVAGGLCTVRGGICGFWAWDRRLVYVAEGLGCRGGTRRGKRPSDGGDGEAQRVCGRRLDAAAVAAFGFCCGTVVRRRLQQSS